MLHFTLQNMRAFYGPWPRGLGLIEQIYMQSWAHVPGFAFPRSRVPGVLGTWARRNAIFFKARRNAEREEVGTLISYA